MGEIYSKADMVLAWLGDVRKIDLSVVEDFLESFCGRNNVEYIFREVVVRHNHPQDLLRALGEQYLKEYLAKHENIDLGYSLSRPLEALYKSSYWKRVWM